MIIKNLLKLLINRINRTFVAIIIVDQDGALEALDEARLHYEEEYAS